MFAVEILMRNLEFQRVPNASLLQNIKNLAPPNFARGFFYFDEISAVSLDQMLADSIDSSSETISISKIVEFQHEENMLQHLRPWQMPYKLLTVILVPDCTKAVQTFACDQTEVDEAQIACTLERYRSGHGNYPKSLNDLLPKYIGKLPHDIIGGQPLKYSKTRDGGFQLYSIGWNQIDDGGQFSSSFDQGDWIWQ